MLNVIALAPTDGAGVLYVAINDCNAASPEPVKYWIDTVAPVGRIDLAIVKRNVCALYHIFSVPVFCTYKSYSIVFAVEMQFCIEVVTIRVA